MITREQALAIPTVASCVNKLAETVARLPIHLHQRQGDKVTEITGDARLKQLNGETGDAMNSVDTWKSVIEDYYFGRGAWIYIEPQFRSIHYVDSRNIGINCNTDPIFKRFTVSVDGKQYYDWEFIKILRKTRNGWENIPMQEESRIIFSASYNALKLENQMNLNGGCKPGFLKSSHRLDQKAIDTVRTTYKRMYSNDGKEIVVLNEGMDFQPVTSTAVELQMNENKKTNSIEICKLFGFPHTIIDGGASAEDKAQFNAVVVALVNQIETALDISFLYEDEKEQGWFWSFDVRELTRGNMKERYEAYAIGLDKHFLQVDEVRREEDLEAIGFNFVTMGLGDILLNPETMEVFTPNTGQTQNLLTGEARATDIELRYNHNHGLNGRFTSGSGGGKISGDSTAKNLTNSQNNVRLDSDGKPFKYPSVKLGKKEYANVMDEIGRNWNSRYEGIEFCKLKFTNKTYFFENHGIGDYNFYKVKKG